MRCVIKQIRYFINHMTSLSLNPPLVNKKFPPNLTCRHNEPPPAYIRESVDHSAIHVQVHY